MGMQYLGITLDRTSTGLENLERPSAEKNSDAVTAPTNQNAPKKPEGESAIPAYRESYDDQRRADVNTILNALWQYAIDNGGVLPGQLSPEPKDVCRSSAESCSGLLDLRDELEGPYLVKIPEDPVTAKTGNGTRYFVKAEGMQITVSAPDAGAEVSVSR